MFHYGLVIAFMTLKNTQIKNMHKQCKVTFGRKYTMVGNFFSNIIQSNVFKYPSIVFLSIYLLNIDNLYFQVKGSIIFFHLSCSGMKLMLQISKSLFGLTSIYF